MSIPNRQSRDKINRLLGSVARIGYMARRTLSMIRRDIQYAESNLSLAESDFKDVKKAYKGYPHLIKELSSLLQTLKAEEKSFEEATSKEKKEWSSAGDTPEIVELCGTSKLFMLAVEKA